MVDKDKITITWTIEDVISRARGRHMNITDQQAREVLFSMKQRHDASIGINWDVIDAHLDFIGE